MHTAVVVGTNVELDTYRQRQRAIIVCLCKKLHKNIKLLLKNLHKGVAAFNAFIT